MWGQPLITLVTTKPQGFVHVLGVVVVLVVRSRWSKVVHAPSPGAWMDSPAATDGSTIWSSPAASGTGVARPLVYSIWHGGDPPTPVLFQIVPNVYETS